MNKCKLRSMNTFQPQIVEGFRDAISELEKRALIDGIYKKRQAMMEKYHADILAAPEPLMRFSELLRSTFSDSVTFEGDENIPPRGKVIFAYNHPFGVPDSHALREYVLKRLHRPWMVIGNASALSTLFPKWKEDRRFTDHWIPVYREGGDPAARVTNPTDVVNNAVQFLNNSEDPILFMAPEGSQALFQNKLGKPRRGLAEIARLTEATIVPVAITGKADTANIIFTLHERILAPFKPSDDDQQTLARWSAAILENMHCQKCKQIKANCECA